VRNELVETSEAKPHHILPDSGWISVYLKIEKDVDRVIKLLRKSYDIAVEEKIKE
jgi:predicted DNA-binding protein (MmcQ/YjbR family)